MNMQKTTLEMSDSDNKDIHQLSSINKQYKVRYTIERFMKNEYRWVTHHSRIEFTSV